MEDVNYVEGCQELCMQAAFIKFSPELKKYIHVYMYITAIAITVLLIEMQIP